MSTEELQQDIISELEVQNGVLVYENSDLRHQLSVHSSPSTHHPSSHHVRNLLLENDSLRKELRDLNVIFHTEKRVICERESAVRRLLGQFRYPESVLEEVRYEMTEEVAILKETVSRSEADISARDQLIGELKVDAADFRRRYQDAISDSDMMSYVLNKQIDELNDRVADANREVSEKSISARDAEQMYIELEDKYCEQTLLNEALNDKLSATEFDLYATVEKLDLLKISERDSSSTRRTVGVMTDALASESERLSSELTHLADKYNSSQCRVSELVIDNASRDCQIAELEQGLAFYQDQLASANPVSNRESSQWELPRLTTEIDKITAINDLLCSRLEFYEDHVLEASDQLSEMAAGTEIETKLLGVSRRLYAILQEPVVKQHKIGRSCIP